ncbi:hypothetical protein BD408DRAFT_470537, partial [Parasitella parasitica]
MVLFDAFPVSFRDVVSVAMSQVSKKKFYDPEYMVNVLRRIAHSVDTKNGTLVPNGLKNRKRGLAENEEHSHGEGSGKDSKKSKWAPGGAGGASGSGGSSVGVGGRPTGKRCWKCNSNNWSRQHVCNTGIKSKEPSKVLRVLSSPSVDTAVNLAVLSAAAGSRSGVSSAFAGDVFSSDEDDVSSGLALDEPMEDVVGLGDLEGRASTLVSTMAKVSVRDDAAAITALNAQDCKFDVRFSAAPA